MHSLIYSFTEYAHTHETKLERESQSKWLKIETGKKEQLRLQL